jgi:hypothetical protein
LFEIIQKTGANIGQKAQGMNGICRNIAKRFGLRINTEKIKSKKNV